MTDAANIIPADDELLLSQRLSAFERETGRQFVIATIPDLEGYPIEDYGYRLGREWGVGSDEEDDGVILLVAPNDRKVRIEVGYGLEPYLTDGYSSLIVQRQILPAFRSGDLVAGIVAGTDAVVEQLALPPEEAAARMQEFEAQPVREGEGGVPWGLIWILLIIAFNVLPMLGRGRRGRRRRGGSDIWFWGPIIASSMSSSSRRSGGFGGGGFGGGGFSGGGGSFGGGGASGSW